MGAFETGKILHGLIQKTRMTSVLPVRQRVPRHEALELFHEMVMVGIESDWIVFVSALYACSHSGLVEEGQELFQRMTDEYDICPLRLLHG
ncbi:Pentatricopeptide repeat-containing protein [Platanthera guangdongensis]|uniref:Pentatricopeptide repeat-containing protein n=1 Tax=Platanthera guangdongensis TaxID=2320717 RepID=A0ABR2MXZ5_9ASPA